MNTKAFDNGYVGIKLNSVSDIMKYNALNTNFSICNEYEDYFDEYVKEDDGTGNFTEREPTENKKLERILQAWWLLRLGMLPHHPAKILRTKFVQPCKVAR